eukprot:TRINITY_DN65494_c0_g1_i1.p1 TRINITY_DN65494_c0_g1~~TRINITY_DN65494_c0_g1_i1.p1  ORF type:complete len:733 (+),score=142.04 TRINITY_DN65494_c0_g1_i1:75-2273(+)
MELASSLPGNAVRALGSVLAGVLTIFRRGVHLGRLGVCIGVESVYTHLQAQLTTATDGEGAIFVVVFAAISQGFGMWGYQWIRHRYMRRAFYAPIRHRSAERRGVEQGMLHPEIPRGNLEKQVERALSTGTCSQLILGSRGCGKSWLLRKLSAKLQQSGDALAYISVRPRSTTQEFIVQLAERMDFRFQQPTSWLVRFVRWVFENHGGQKDASEASSEVSCFHRLTAALELAAREISAGNWEHRGTGRMPTLVIDNLQNLHADPDDSVDDDAPGTHVKFIISLVEWAAWCADKRILRVVLGLPSTPHFDKVLQSSPHLASLQTLEFPPLRKEVWLEDAMKHLCPTAEKNDEARHCALAVLSIVESPLDAKKVWDSCTQLRLGWDRVARLMLAQGFRLLRNYDLDNLAVSGDPADDKTRARTWRLLLHLIDDRHATYGVLPHDQRHLGDASKVVDELTHASHLCVRILGGEMRVGSAPLRYLLSKLAVSGSEVPEDRKVVDAQLERLDPDWKKEWRFDATGPVSSGRALHAERHTGMRGRRLSRADHDHEASRLARRHDELDEQANRTLVRVAQMRSHGDLSVLHGATSPTVESATPPMCIWSDNSPSCNPVPAPGHLYARGTSSLPPALQPSGRAATATHAEEGLGPVRAICEQEAARRASVGNAPMENVGAAMCEQEAWARRASTENVGAAASEQEPARRAPMENVGAVPQPALCGTPLSTSSGQRRRSTR